MSDIYQSGGQSVYDYNGVTMDAHTGLPVSGGPTPTNSTVTTPPISTPVNLTTPTTISSDTPTYDYIPDYEKRLSSLTSSSGANRQTYTDSQGFLRYSDDLSVVEAPADATPNESGSWESGGQIYGSGPKYSEDPVSNSLYQAQIKNLDASTRSRIASISQRYDTLKAQQQDINKRYEAGVGQTLLMAGSDRYAPISSEGIVNTAMTKGMQEIASLDAEEQQLIQSAKDAQATGKYKVMGDAISQAEAIRKQKQDETNKMNDVLVKAQQDAKAKRDQATKDNAVGNLLSQGISDPKQILSLLNKAGGTFSAKDVSDAIKSLTADNPSGKAILDLLDTARNNGAPADVLSKIGSSTDLNAALTAAGKFSAGGTGIIGEYNYAKANGYSGSFSQYQNEDANRKAKASGGGTGLPDGFTGAMQNGKTGQALMESLSAIDRATVQSILDYTKNPSNLSLRKAAGESQSEREKFLSMAHLIDPTYDETQYAARAATKKDFMAGKSATNIKSLNTAVAHLDVLKNAADGLSNAPIGIWNSIKNKGLTAIGDPRVVRFNNAATAVENELANVFKGTGATDQEIKQWRDNINSSQSPEQLHVAIDTAIELMSGRIAALQAQYENGMGKPKDFKFLSSQSRQILSKLGVDPDGIDPSLPSNTSTADSIVGDDRAAIGKIQQFHDASPENSQLIDELHTRFPNVSAAEIAKKLGL